MRQHEPTREEEIEKGRLSGASFTNDSGRSFRSLLAAKVGAVILGAASLTVVTSPAEEAPRATPAATGRQPDRAANPLAGSLPRHDGNATVPGLESEVVVAKDSLGVVVIRGATLEDTVRAQGFVHAQERFFQMDLARRLAGGTLAEILGATALPSDRNARAQGFARAAERILEKLPAGERKLLEAYTDGANAGLKDLAAPPPEYGMLGTRPAPWSAKDSVLVVLAMFDSMHFNERLERPRGVMKEALPEKLYEFLTPYRTRFDAPLVPDAAPFRKAAIPGPEVVDLRERPAGAAPVDVIPPPAPGSNNFAVDAAHSKSGHAIVANDPHLLLSAPGTWYRCELHAGEKRLAGVSLPGSPGIVIGSNGRVSWGFTNSLGDFQDLVIVEKDPSNPARYLTPDGPEAFETIKETIRVKGEADREVTLQKTRWGIVSGSDWHGRPLVMKWTALEPEAVNLAILRMIEADTVADGVEIMRKWYGPSQNVLLADADGRIAWVVSGYFPKRTGMDGTVPVSWAREGVGWSGALDEADRPSIVNPRDGILFTANNRTVGEEASKRLGITPDLGARAKRIHELLTAKDKLSEDDLLAVQLDTRLEMLDFYKELLLELTRDAGAGTLRAEARKIVEGWNGRADADQAAMRILSALREELHGGVLGPLLAPCTRLDPGFQFYSLSSEEPVLRILEERPAHLVPPGSRDWSTFLGKSLDETLERLKTAGGEKGLRKTWGEDNTSFIAHPLYAAAPEGLKPLLAMPRTPISGSHFTVKVLEPSYGASMRMAVAPGDEKSGILHMPAGQSGNPLSPHFRDGHKAWAEGTRAPFRAGDTAESFELKKPE